MNNTNRFYRIDDLLGLHQDLSIIYVVDGYEAELRNEDGYPSFVCVGFGDTIDSALLDLNKNLIAFVPYGWTAIDTKNNGLKPNE